MTNLSELTRPAAPPEPAMRTTAAYARALDDAATGRFSSDPVPGGDSRLRVSEGQPPRRPQGDDRPSSSTRWEHLAALPMKARRALIACAAWTVTGYVGLCAALVAGSALLTPERSGWGPLTVMACALAVTVVGFARAITRLRIGCEVVDTTRTAADMRAP